MKRSLLTLILCCVYLFVLGQSADKKMKLTFAIDYEQKNALDFTSKDAQKLFQFFTNKSEVRICEEKKMKVISRVYEKRADKKAYKDQDMIKTLNMMGFAVSDLECYEENIVFKLYKSAEANKKAVSFNEEEFYPEDFMLPDDGSMVLTLAAPEMELLEKSATLTAVNPTLISFLPLLLSNEATTPIEPVANDNSLVEEDELLLEADLEVTDNLDYLSLSMFEF